MPDTVPSAHKICSLTKFSHQPYEVGNSISLSFYRKQSRPERGEARHCINTQVVWSQKPYFYHSACKTNTETNKNYLSEHLLLSAKPNYWLTHS